jgi:hypothetical protein
MSANKHRSRQAATGISPDQIASASWGEPPQNVALAVVLAGLARQGFRR